MKFKLKVRLNKELSEICDKVKILISQYASDDMVSIETKVVDKKLFIEYFIFGELVCTVIQTSPFDKKEIHFTDSLDDFRIEDWVYENFEGGYEYVKQ